MIIKCAWCGKDMGEKPPYEDKSVTHSICEECEAKYFPEKGKRGDAMKIPTTRVSALGFQELELPVARAVEALVGEKPISSGFHEKLNQRWTIVFRDICQS